MRTITAREAGEILFTNDGEENEARIEFMLELGWMKKVGQADGEPYYEITPFAIECARDPQLMDALMRKYKQGVGE